MISTCGRDENGRYTGGKAGDQTGNEWLVRSWYNFPYDMVLRHPNSKVREKIAELAEEAANNNKIGYDQSQRTTFWTQLTKSNYRPKNIKTACECDCSAGVAAIVKAVGYLLNIDALKKVSEYDWTGVMKNDFKKAGFEVLTEKKYRDSDAYELRGDVLLNEKSHAAINLTNGLLSGELNSSSNPTANNQAAATSTENATVINKMQNALYFEKGHGGGVKYNTTSSIHLRYGAGIKHESIMIMPKNTTCIWYGYYNIAPNGKRWLYVAVNGKVGYASSVYLKKK